jgi:hypothetical protein
MPVKNNNRADRGKNRKSGNAPAETLEQKRTRLAKEYGIKPKTKAVIDELIENPQLTNTEAYMRHHKTSNKNTAATAMNKLLKKPSVIGYKDSAVKSAKRRIISLVDSENESIALKASQDIIDRNEGKAIQKTETNSKVVEIKLDLSGSKLGNHFIVPSSTPDQIDPVS